MLGDFCTILRSYCNYERETSAKQSPTKFQVQFQSGYFKMI